MKTMHALVENEISEPPEPSAFLEQWIRSGTLLSLILDSAQSVEWPESERKLAASSGYAFRRLVLLTVVTYCYAAGVYDSKEIARKIAQDEILRFLCAGSHPTAQDIREFAHPNHSLIKDCLLRTCQLAHEFVPQIRPVLPQTAQLKSC